MGIDGMDPVILQELMDKGEMPHFKQLGLEGDFCPLQTSMPPQSPVAWSSFITGLDPGGHGIFDFVHRDPKTMLPFLSMSQALPARHNLHIGKWVIPLSKGKVEQLRKGKAFWQILDEKGIPTIVMRIPANFPPVPSRGRSLSGMGTPDIQGTPGTFSFYTDHPPANAEDVSGGKVYPVKIQNHQVKAELVGPKNPFRKHTPGSPAAVCTIPFIVYLDPEEAVAKLVVNEKEIILCQGEWSEWIRLDFEAFPFWGSISSIGRFYLKQIRPHFELYVTPLQINPEDPAMPISTPADWCCELCESLGYFYTQELPEDTKALSAGIFSGKEFKYQADLVYKEQQRALDYLLSQYRDGLLFFYFSSIDQQSHMLWRYSDREHPGFLAEPGLDEGIRSVYRNMDEELGKVLKTMDDQTTLIVMSDHGFCPFYRGVNLNTWLYQKGYLVLKEGAALTGVKYYQNVDWKRTRAYALGLNGLYINLAGREKDGIVPAGEYDRLLDSLEKDLLALTDPQNGQQVVSLALKTRREYHGPYVDQGPDILVGYARGYRSSWESPLGEMTTEVFQDNKDAWSADHCIDYRVVPGVLLTNRKVTLESPSLCDLTVAILDEYGLAPLPEMRGKDCLSSKETTIVSGQSISER